MNHHNSKAARSNLSHQFGFQFNGGFTTQGAKVLILIVIGIASMLVSCSTAPKVCRSPVAPIPAATAEDLLQRMAGAYDSVRTYADSGVVYDYRNGVREEASISFRIHYVRPGRIRFEMTDNVGSKYQPEDYRVLWSDGNATYSWWQSYPHLEPSRDVVTGISGFTGISRRSVHNIPSLLQTNFGWQEYLHQISAPRIVGEEVFEQVDCYRVEGKGRGERQFEIWVGKSDCLIRKILTTYPTFSSEEIHRGIAINQPISPEMLGFTPPVSAKDYGKH